LDRTKEATAENTAMTLTLALSYSGRHEIVQVARRLAQKVKEGTLQADAIDESTIEKHLDTAGMPNPDLLIRTGGEYRLSNFLLWQCAYTELYITEEHWPSFRRPALYEAIRSFQSRDRRFGRIEQEAYNEQSSS
jgi:undecaprenyl diphosphate synthase